MARGKKKAVSDEMPTRKPSTTEGRETLLISLAVDLAEKQLREGTAPPSVVSHYLKLGSTRENLEREKLKAENELLKAKAAAIEKSATMEEVYKQVVEAYRSYSPTPEEEFNG